jgi:hypothetical protein
MLADRGPRPSAERLASLLERYADRLHAPSPQDDVAIVALRFGGETGDAGQAAEPTLADHAGLPD